MKFSLASNPTSVILTVFIQDSSATDGSGLSGLLHTSGITGGYVQRDGTGVALTVDEDVSTEGTYQAPSAANKVRIGTPANMPNGFYELHFHDDVFASADWVTIGLEGATNMAALPIEVQMGAHLSAVEVNAEVVDVLRTDLIPDSYSTDGNQPTIAEAILEIRQFLTERAVSSTTVTVKKPDGSTSAMTFTLDDGTTPTSITRAS